MDTYALHQIELTNMTELEKLLEGELYDYSDAEIEQLHTKLL